MNGFSLLFSGSTFFISLYNSLISTNFTSNLSNDQIWFGLLVLRTSMAGSLTKPIRFRFGLRLAGGIWRVTLKRVCLPSSSAKTLASLAKALARTISSRSWARLRRKFSSFSWAQRSDRPDPLLPLLLRKERLLKSNDDENDDEGDIGESIEDRSCCKWRSYSCFWRCRALCLSSSCCFSSRAIAVCDSQKDQYNMKLIGLFVQTIYSTWIGSFDISLSTSSSRAKLKSGWMCSSPVGLGRGQFTRKKWLLPHKRRSPCLSRTREMTGDPFRKQGALPRGSIKSCPFSISNWQCSDWIPRPESWISGWLSASFRPTKVRS